MMGLECLIMHDYGEHRSGGKGDRLEAKPGRDALRRRPLLIEKNERMYHSPMHAGTGSHVVFSTEQELSQACRLREVRGTSRGPDPPIGWLTEQRSVQIVRHRFSTFYSNTRGSFETRTPSLSAYR